MSTKVPATLRMILSIGRVSRKSDHVLLKMRLIVFQMSSPLTYTLTLEACDKLHH